MCFQTVELRSSEHLKFPRGCLESCTLGCLNFKKEIRSASPAPIWGKATICKWLTLQPNLSWHPNPLILRIPSVNSYKNQSLINEWISSSKKKVLNNSKKDAWVKIYSKEGVYVTFYKWEDALWNTAHNLGHYLKNNSDYIIFKTGLPGPLRRT